MTASGARLSGAWAVALLGATALIAALMPAASAPARSDSFGELAARTGSEATAAAVSAAAGGAMGRLGRRDAHLNRRRAARRVAIRPPHGRPFLPALGDWDGSASGYPLSFELLYRPAIGRLYHRSPYVFSDVTLVLPQVSSQTPGCPASGVAGESFDEGLLEPLGSGGRLVLPEKNVHLAIIGPRSARVSIDATYPAAAGFPAACNRTFTGTLHPARRSAVRDGTWTLRFQGGASSTFTVTGGGRLVSGVEVPAACGLAMPGSLVLFIEPDGRASSAQAGVYAMSLDFTTSGSASAQLSLGGGQCLQTASATLTKPAR